MIDDPQTPAGDDGLFEADDTVKVLPDGTMVPEPPGPSIFQVD